MLAEYRLATSRQCGARLESETAARIFQCSRRIGGMRAVLSCRAGWNSNPGSLSFSWTTHQGDGCGGNFRTPSRFGLLLWTSLRHEFVRQHIGHDANLGGELQTFRVARREGQLHEESRPTLGRFRNFSYVNSATLIGKRAALVFWPQRLHSKVARIRVGGLPEPDLVRFVLRRHLD
jgi:hypothetical protein